VASLEESLGDRPGVGAIVVDREDAVGVDGRSVSDGAEADRVR
jgi:hypothetical protein